MDVHLMIAPVDPLLPAFLAARPDVVTVHLESGPHVLRTLQAIRAGGAKAGLAVNPGTGIDALPWMLDAVDLICVMTVNPGFGGQDFLASQLPKIAAIRAMVGDRPIHIEVDGGVTEANARDCVRAGADVLVAGSSVFNGGSVADPAPYGANIRRIRAAASG
jgi:ribulose-phosphate 3-epimerase